MRKQINKELKQTIISILEPHGAKKIAIFGSRARAEAKPESDIDIIVELPASASLFDIGRLREELCEALGIEVDLISEGALQQFPSSVKKDMIVIYGEQKRS